MQSFQRSPAPIPLVVSREVVPRESHSWLLKHILTFVRDVHDQWKQYTSEEDSFYNYIGRRRSQAIAILAERGYGPTQERRSIPFQCLTPDRGSDQHFRPEQILVEQE